MGYMNTAIATANAIKESLQKIKAAANVKGANIIDTDALDVWDDRIAAIPAQYKPEFYANTSGVIQWCIPADVIEIPGEDETGQVLSTSLADFGGITPKMCKKIHIPQYFISANLSSLASTSTSSQNYGFCVLEEIDCESATVTFGNNTKFGYKGCNNVKKLNFKNATTLNCEFFDMDAVDVSAYPWYSLPTTLEINIPYVETWTPIQVGRVGNPRALTLNAPRLKTFLKQDTSSQSMYNRGGIMFCTGTVVLPSCENFGITNVCYAGTLAIRLPSIKSMPTHWCFNKADGTTGTTKIYLGPNLATLNGNAASNIIANVAEVHIPAGDSTTKTTLDNAGITYTQDYDYESDLLS